MPAIILIRGGGDLASGVALRLHGVGLGVVMTELAEPLAVRRTVAFAEAIYEGKASVEGTVGQRVSDPTDALKTLNILANRRIAVLVDPSCSSASSLHPLVVIDGRMTKHAPEPFSHHALLYVGLGPGFEAPTNCHVVVETQRGHNLGRLIWSGAAAPDSGEPAGDRSRVLRAPTDGVVESEARIGRHYEAGAELATVDGQPVIAAFAGVLRGIIHRGVRVQQGAKIGDLDPRDDPRLCETVSDKALAVGGAVLEALLTRPEVRTKLWD